MASEERLEKVLGCMILELQGLAEAFALHLCEKLSQLEAVHKEL